MKTSDDNNLQTIDHDSPLHKRYPLHDVPKDEVRRSTIELGDCSDPTVDIEPQIRGFIDRKQEKRLLRRIDWHLLPLLAILYMIKTLDFINVCGIITSTSSNIMLTICLDLQRAYHGSRDI